MTPRGDIIDTPINQRDLAPWLSTTTDNEDYFYDGTTRDFDITTPRHKPASKNVSFDLGSLEGDSVTPL